MTHANCSVYAIKNHYIMPLFMEARSKKRINVSIGVTKIGFEKIRL